MFAVDNKSTIANKNTNYTPQLGIARWRENHTNQHNKTPEEKQPTLYFLMTQENTSASKSSGDHYPYKSSEQVPNRSSLSNDWRKKTPEQDSSIHKEHSKVQNILEPFYKLLKSAGIAINRNTYFICSIDIYKLVAHEELDKFIEDKGIKNILSLFTGMQKELRPINTDIIENIRLIYENKLICKKKSGQTPNTEDYNKIILFCMNSSLENKHQLLLELIGEMKATEVPRTKETYDMIICAYNRVLESYDIKNSVKQYAEKILVDLYKSAQNDRSLVANIGNPPETKYSDIPRRKRRNMISAKNPNTQKNNPTEGILDISKHPTVDFLIGGFKLKTRQECSILIKICNIIREHNGKVKNVSELFHKLREAGIAINTSTYSVAIAKFAQHEQIDDASMLFVEMQEKNVSINTEIGNMLLPIYEMRLKYKQESDQTPNTDDYNNIIMLLCICSYRQNKLQELLELIEEMKIAGVPRTKDTYNMVISTYREAMKNPSIKDDIKKHIEETISNLEKFAQNDKLSL